MPKMLTGPRSRRHPRLTHLRSVVLQSIFQQLYGRGARIYDRLTRMAFAGEWKRWQAAAIPWLPGGGVIVELGSGTGNFASVAAAGSRSWIGLDISPKMIATATHHHNPPTLTFVRASAAAMPLRSGIADGIVATFPSPFIFDSRVAAEMGRILKQDGRLVVVLSGALSAVGFRRSCTRAVLAVIQGAESRGEPWTPEIAGFDGRSEWQPTEFGRALVYIGRRL